MFRRKNCLHCITRLLDVIDVNILMTLSNPFTSDPRVFNEAKSLVDAGFKVTVLAWDKTGAHPAEETIEGIRVIRSANSTFMNLLPFELMQLHWWWRKGFSDAVHLFEKNRFDVVHSHDLSSLPIGVKLKKKYAIPLIYDAHEIFGYMLERDIPQWAAKYYLRLEKKIIKNVDKIITVNQPLKDYFTAITDIPVIIIMNCKTVHHKSYRPAENDRFTVLFIGTIGPPRFLLELVEVVQTLPDVYCIIGGKGHNTQYIEALKKKCMRVSNAEFIGKVKMDDVLPMTMKADAVVCMTNPMDPNNSRALANKQFEAMACGRPIICTKNTYPGTFTEQHSCGLVAKYETDDLKKKIIQLRDSDELRERLGKNALKAAKKQFNWHVQEQKLLELYMSFER